MCEQRERLKKCRSFSTAKYNWFIPFNFSYNLVEKTIANIKIQSYFCHLEILFFSSGAKIVSASFSI